MENEKTEILSVYQLDEHEKNKIIRKYFHVEPAVCAGGGAALYLHPDGTVEAVGDTGDYDFSDKWINIRKICSGSDHIIGLRSDGKVVSFGKNTYGQCNVESWENVRDIFAGGYYSAAVTEDEHFLFAGRSDNGSIGQKELRNEIDEAFAGCDNNNQVRFSEVFAAIERLNASFESHKNESKSVDTEALKNKLKAELQNELKTNDKKLDALKKDLKKELLIELRTELRTAAAAMKSGPGSSEKRCVKCMKIYSGGKYCPYCGFDTSYKNPSPLLPAGYKLKNGKYLVGAKLSQNKEGIRYVGYSEDLKQKVVIHEFLPLQLCMRPDQNDYVRIVRGMEKNYIALREKFMKYYYAVSTVTANSVVKIHDVFSESGTSYVIEEFVDGVSLTKYIAHKGKGLDWNTTARMFRPIAAALGDLHSKKEGHYAVSPDHIMVGSNGELKLIGFSINDIRQSGGILEADLVQGCSALEQYDPNASLDETTDVYGFTATICYALTGVTIEDANMRKDRSAISIPAGVFNTLPKTAVDLIKGGLWVSQTSRIRTFKYILSYIL